MNNGCQTCNNFLDVFRTGLDKEFETSADLSRVRVHGLISQNINKLNKVVSIGAQDIQRDFGALLIEQIWN